MRGKGIEKKVFFLIPLLRKKNTRLCFVKINPFSKTKPTNIRYLKISLNELSTIHPIMTQICKQNKKRKTNH